VGILGVDLILPPACKPPTARNLDRLPLTANDVDGCDQPRLPSAVRALRAANIIGVLGLLAGTISRDLVRPAGREGSSQPTLNPQRALHLGRDPSLDSPIPRTSALHRASWDRRASTEWCSTCFFSSLKLWSYMSNGGATRVLGSLSELRRISRGRIASTCIVASLERRRSALLDPGKPMVQRLAASVADCETGNSFWAGSERVGGRTGDGDPLIKKQVVAQQSR
jgi:hypothetical protein